jgi:hypothetical protein
MNAIRVPITEIERFLVSGTEEQLQHFHLAVCLLANDVSRRGDTVCYTVVPGGVPCMFRAAEVANVTLQQRARSAPFWPVVRQGPAPAWNAPSPKVES